MRHAVLVQLWYLWCFYLSANSHSIFFFFLFFFFSHIFLKYYMWETIYFFEGKHIYSLILLSGIFYCTVWNNYLKKELFDLDFHLINSSPKMWCLIARNGTSNYRTGNSTCATECYFAVIIIKWMINVQRVHIEKAKQMNRIDDDEN